MGFLDMITGSGPDDPRSQAADQMIYGLLSGNVAGGLLGAGNVFAGARDRQLKRGLLEAQLDETRAQAEARKALTAREQAELERQQRIRAELPSLFRAPGMTGGAPVPQTFGGTDVPMFSAPSGVSPMQSAPGGFDVQRAISLGLDPKAIEAYAGLQNIGRPKASRQMEIDDGRGGKRIALVDDFGREVAGFAGYTAPVQVNQGDRVSFVKPAPGVNMPINMSPDAKESNALGWANNALTRRGQDLTDARAREANVAGKVPAGYRLAANGQGLEYIPGGPADPARNGEKMPSEGERKAATLLHRLESSQQQLVKALGDNPDAAKPEMFPSAVRGARLPLLGGIPGAAALANTTTSQERQRVEAAQLDMLDAALTLGTGAAYTREQLEGYRQSYFPQIGDSKETVRDKQVRLQNIIEAAKIAAGRAAPSRAAVNPQDDPLGLRK